MQFVFCILFFNQFDAFEKVFSKCFNNFDVLSFIISNIRPLRGGGGGASGQRSKLCILLSDLPVVLMITRGKKGRKVSKKGQETLVINVADLD